MLGTQLSLSAIAMVLFAQSDFPSIGGLAEKGILGVIVGFLMWLIHIRIKAVEDAISSSNQKVADIVRPLERGLSDLAKSQLLLVVANHDASTVVKGEAQRALDELEERRRAK